MRAIDYPYYVQSFPEYNVAQASVIPFADQDNNLVISFATASGKTAIACAVFGYHLSTEESSKIVYVSPFKSISSEKYDEWSEDYQLSKHGVMLCTGDNSSTVQDFRDSRLVVITNESFDSKTRNENYDDWLSKISCVVFDEAHVLGTSRGSAMESAILRFTAKNKKARIVFLSATMSNVRQIATWLKSLNGKTTKMAYSSWRPNKVDIELCVVEGGWQNKIDKAVEQASESDGDKMIVFVHSKKVGLEIGKKLRKLGVRCSFHNASLSPKKRKDIERLFSSDSGMNVLIATSTLGAGVNLG